MSTNRDDTNHLYTSGSYVLRSTAGSPSVLGSTGGGDDNTLYSHDTESGPYGGANVMGTYNRYANNIPINVVKDTDARRGFRLFDGATFGVKDVSSEELFLERMRVAYAAFDRHVTPVLDGTVADVTRAILRAVGACLNRYFGVQSRARAAKPFITKTLYMNSEDMFCTTSDLCRGVLFTASNTKDLTVINDMDRYFARARVSAACTGAGVYRPPEADGVRNRSSATSIYGDEDNVGLPADAHASQRDALCSYLMKRVRERTLLNGGPGRVGTKADPYTGLPDYTETVPNGDTGAPRHDRRLEDRYGQPVYTQSLADEYGSTLSGIEHEDLTGATSAPLPRGTAEALLILLVDFEALHNFITYSIYMTPVDLSRRYGVEFSCLKRVSASVNNPYVVNAATRCCVAKEAARKNRDITKNVVLSVFAEKQRQSAETSRNNSGTCRSEQPANGAYDDLYATDHQGPEARQVMSRSRDILRHIVLLLFDKTLSNILDQGFDNYNRRRRNIINSKDIGGATIYTGIIDTIGTVSAAVHNGLTTLDDESELSESTKTRPKSVSTTLNLKLPLNDLVAQVGTENIAS